MSLAERLARIDEAIAGHRVLYLRCVWAGHDGEAQAHEVEIDRLIRLYEHLRTHQLTVT